MNSSILNDTKKYLGLEETYTIFDRDIIMLINSALANIYQIGAGKQGYTIDDESSVWSDFIDNSSVLPNIKNYVYYHVKLGFDPPTNSFLVSNIEKLRDEAYFRIGIMVDPSPW